MRVLTVTTWGRSGPTLDGRGRHHPEPQDGERCYRYGSPSRAGRPAQADADGGSRRSLWISGTPISPEPSDCSAKRGGRLATGHAEMIRRLRALDHDACRAGTRSRAGVRGLRDGGRGQVSHHPFGISQAQPATDGQAVGQHGLPLDQSVGVRPPQADCSSRPQTVAASPATGLGVTARPWPAPCPQLGHRRSGWKSRVNMVIGETRSRCSVWPCSTFALSRA
jgi:hypothetical protein